MDRAAAINKARVGAQKLWAGTVHIHANAKTGAHHHGHLEVCCCSSRRRFRVFNDTADATDGSVADHCI